MKKEPPRHELELLNRILTGMPALESGWVICGRSDLTRRLCHHPNRPGAMTTAHLDTFIPKLIEAGLACHEPRGASPGNYVFRPVTKGEARWRQKELQAEFATINAETTDPIQREALYRISLEWRSLMKLWPLDQAPPAA
ncbi:MAG: hypothetical protein JWR69_168 [Pedosphaera sp.]|nr:hypothetical protein [Pedosphaera sp.]